MLGAQNAYREMSQSVSPTGLVAGGSWTSLLTTSRHLPGSEGRGGCSGHGDSKGRGSLGGVSTWYFQEVSGTVWLEEEFAWVGQTVSPGGSCFWGVGATGGFHTGK